MLPELLPRAQAENETRFENKTAHVEVFRDLRWQESGLNSQLKETGHIKPQALANADCNGIQYFFIWQIITKILLLWPIITNFFLFLLVI